jgi:hypothetical protein
MKTILILITAIMLTNCAYKPVIDTAGRSGTFDASKSDEITNDIQHCNELASQNTNILMDYSAQAENMYFHWGTLGLIPKRELNHHKIAKKCLEGRGHSVVK